MPAVLDNLIRKLDEIDAQHVELSQALLDPETLADHLTYACRA